MLSTEINLYESTEEIITHIISKKRDQMPKEEIIKDLSNFFKVLGDSSRVKILFGLGDSEMCVQHISELLEMTQSATSHQLRTLRQSKLVKSRREGKQIFYSLADEHILQILSVALDHAIE